MAAAPFRRRCSYLQGALLCALSAPCASPQTSSAAEFAVDVRNYSFASSSLAIKVGDSVTWSNSGGTHNVASSSGLFGNVVSGEAWIYRFTFDSPGSYAYHCSVHSYIGMSGNILVRAGNAAPVVAVSAPAAGASFAANDPVEVSAIASDDIKVVSVEFLDGTDSLGLVSADPFRINKVFSPGSHSITARAVDDEGASTTSNPLVFRVENNLRPSVALTRPASGAYVFTPAPLMLEVNATDEDGSIAKVDYFNEGVPLASSTQPPFSVSLPNLPSNRMILTAVATDNKGSIRVSAAVTVYVAPRVRLSAKRELDGTLTVATTPTYQQVTLQTASAPNAKVWGSLGTGRPGGGQLVFTGISASAKAQFFRALVED